jgi:hypothetical protein
MNALPKQEIAEQLPDIYWVKTLLRTGGALLLLSIPLLLTLILCVYGCVWMTKRIVCCHKKFLQLKDRLIFNLVLRIGQTMYLPLSIFAGLGLYFVKEENRTDDYSKYII